MIENNIIENSITVNNIIVVENNRLIVINSALIITNLDIMEDIILSQIGNSLFYLITDYNRHHNNCSHSHNKNNRSKKCTR